MIICEYPILVWTTLIQNHLIIMQLRIPILMESVRF